MTALARVSKHIALYSRLSALNRNVALRSFATEGSGDDKPPEKAPGWLTRLLMTKPGGYADKIVTGKESYSRLLSEKDVVYELQFNAVEPAFMEEYLHIYETFVNTFDKQTGAELTGSWTVEIGNQDEAIHLWKYPGGYPVLNKAREMYRTDKEFVEFRKKRNEMLRFRKNQILLPFSFWGDIQPREGKWMYELRSYTLRPGTLSEWGNNWQKGLKARQANQESVGGFFTQIGDIYNVHHIWAYESLQSRKEVREAAWRRPGWDECIAYTVPLIKQMTSRILIPTPFSPMQ